MRKSWNGRCRSWAGWGTYPGGPLLADRLSGQPGLRTAVLTGLCDELTALSRGRKGTRMLFVQPPPGAETVSDELLERGFRLSDAGVAPAQTLRLDLTQEPAALRSGLSKRLRTWTNRWSSRGVTVRRGTAADLPLVADLVANSGEHHGYLPVTADYLHKLCTELPDTVWFVGEMESAEGRSAGAPLRRGSFRCAPLRRRGSFRCAPLRRRGSFRCAPLRRPVAAALFTRCAGTLKLRFAGMDRDEAVSRSNVPAAVQWHAVNWAREAGLRWFDFGGISAEAADLLANGGRRSDISGAMRGVDRFKASFGGELYRCPPAVELISPAPLRVVYDLSRRWSAGRRLIELAKRGLRTGRLTGARG